VEKLRPVVLKRPHKGLLSLAGLRRSRVGPLWTNRLPNPRESLQHTLPNGAQRRPTLSSPSSVPTSRAPSLQRLTDLREVVRVQTYLLFLGLPAARVLACPATTTLRSVNLSASPGAHFPPCRISL